VAPIGFQIIIVSFEILINLTISPPNFVHMISEINFPIMQNPYNKSLFTLFPDFCSMNTQQKEILLNDFLYDLPEEKIARYPLSERDLSKQLVFKNNNIIHDQFRNLSSHLDAHDLLVINETKVIKARLKFKKSTGGSVEVFCLHPLKSLDPSESLSSKSGIEWVCLIKGGKRWKDEILSLRLNIDGDQNINLFAKVVHKSEMHSIVRFEWDSANYVFADILFYSGAVPIPPYLKREAESVDESRYQTVFASIAGSVAAPTAGLHFTDAILNELSAKGVKRAKLLLHVGAGTFKPIQSENVLHHEMHDESFSINTQALRDLLQAKGKIIPVGTTAMRTLESLYQLAMRHALSNSGWKNGVLAQHEIYQSSLSRNELIQTLIDLSEKEGGVLKGQTGIMISPGYSFGFCDGLITNFHQPGSTLILLVAAFVGPIWRSIYNEALSNNYRFLSYGDSSLLLP